MSASRAPRFGANYTPSRDWMFAWYNLNLDDVRRDMDALARIGLDHVRLLPLWPVLQPNRTLIRADAVDDVRAVVDVVAEFGMDASVDVLQGHLSSFDIMPSWLTSWHQTNLFTDEPAVSAQVRLVESLGTRLKDAPNFLGLTLGNEVNQFSGDPHPQPMRATSDEVKQWMTRLLDGARAVAPSHPHVHAEYDAAFYLDGHPFTPAHAAQVGDQTVIHSWVFNGTAQRYGGMSHESLHHGEYMIELARAFATDPERVTWLQEVGAPSNCVTAEQAPDFLAGTVQNALSCESLWGVTWWCSHDVSRTLGDFPELEYTLGLVDQKHRIKPIGQRFAEVIAETKASTPVIPARRVGIEIQVGADGTPLDRSSLGPGGSVFDEWTRLARDGRHPTCVTSAATREALAIRGIDEVVAVAPRGPAGGYSAVNTVVPTAPAIEAENPGADQ